MMSILARVRFAAGGKIAYVDTQTVFDKTKLGKKYQGSCANTMRAGKRSWTWMRRRSRNCRRINKQKQAKLLNEKAQKEKEETISRRSMISKRSETSSADEIGKKNEECPTNSISRCRCSERSRKT